mgnify:CR=1 FL=1
MDKREWNAGQRMMVTVLSSALLSACAFNSEFTIPSGEGAVMDKLVLRDGHEKVKMRNTYLGKGTDVLGYPVMCGEINVNFDDVVLTPGEWISFVYRFSTNQVATQEDTLFAQFWGRCVGGPRTTPWQYKPPEPVR